VGWTLSPHLVDFRERIQINNEFIPKPDVVRYHKLIKQKLGLGFLTYFEWVTIMAFLHFKEQKVDVAVLETGMGGRWDTTNVCQPLVGVITNVSYDHEAILGDTLEKILGEKMQIVKKGMDVWTGIKESHLLAQLKTHCEQVRAFFHQADLGVRAIHELPLQGRHQIQNAALAMGVCQSLRQRGWVISDENIKTGMKATVWPGRLEIISEKPYILLDCAHNPAGVQVLADFLKTQSRKYKLIFTTLSDRPFKSMLKALLPSITEVHIPFLKENRAWSSDDLRQKIEAMALDIPVFFMDLNRPSWENFKSRLKLDDSVLVTGSIYLVSEIRQMLKEYS